MSWQSYAHDESVFVHQAVVGHLKVGENAGFIILFPLNHQK